MTKQKSAAQEYRAESIQVLTGLEPVRKRPGMYIGSTGVTGLHHLVWEVIDNAVDEAMAGFADDIQIEILEDNKIRVTDNGRGIPVEKHPQTKKSTLETVLTILHAGGKFGGGGYKVSGGLHGVGVSVVNALSEWTEARVMRDGKIYAQQYKRGVPQGDVKPVGKSSHTGTTISFKPDPDVFETTTFNLDTILDYARQQAYLTKGITVKVKDYRSNATYGFHFEGGIQSYIKHFNKNRTLVNESIFYIDKELNDITCEIALQYTDRFNENIYTYANNIHTIEGGMYLTGFRASLTRVLNDYARKFGYLKNSDPTLQGEDTREGLTAIISVKLKNPQFEGQTKAKLGNPEVRTVVESIMGEGFVQFLEEHPDDAKKIMEKVFLAAKARMAARAARDSVIRKGILEGITLPGKLADCSEKNPDRSELFIVEGDSAGGCFSGDTKIALTDGRNITFKELVNEYRKGKKSYCYTIQKDGNIGIALIENPRKTKIAAKAIKIILDNGEEIICTPDHKFMLRSGIYKKAFDLKSDDSLMPLYRKHSEIGGRITIDGYEMVLNSKDMKWIFTHLLADKYNLDSGAYIESEGFHKHHIDFNKLNNNPDNIIRMAKDEHLKYHRELAHLTLHTEETKEKCRKIHQTPEFRERIRKVFSSLGMKKMLSERAKKQWGNQQYKEYMVKKFLEFYHNNSEYREKNNKLLNKLQKLYWGDDSNRKKQSERIREYFESNPDKKGYLSTIAKEQWNDRDLRKWRSGMTKKQWTDEFREKRKKAYDQTYLRKALEVLSMIYKDSQKINKEAYNNIRKQRGDRSIISIDTICYRFFGGDKNKLEKAVVNYNHKVKAVIPMKTKMDVYDLEVSQTHNFALASGVFVHNSAKQGRNRNFQAILPLRGKILNVEKARLDRMLASNEVKALIIALGTAIGDQMDISKLRYGRIIIMTDADVDGAHIRTLLLTLFYRYFEELITKGHLYIAQPPLYKIQKGKEAHYAYTDADKEEILSNFGVSKVEEDIKVEEAGEGEKEERAIEENRPDGEQEEGKEKEETKVKGVMIQRYKGLGEMNPEQLWETTMDQENRVLYQVNVEDAEKANEIFNIFMGDDVLPRKRFIQAHAKSVKNLDV